MKLCTIRVIWPVTDATIVLDMQKQHGRQHPTTITKWILIATYMLGMTCQAIDRTIKIVWSKNFQTLTADAGCLMCGRVAPAHNRLTLAQAPAHLTDRHTGVPGSTE